MTADDVFAGMTVNERLAAAGRFDEFDRAAALRDRELLTSLLQSLEISDPDFTVHRVLANPSFYGLRKAHLSTPTAEVRDSYLAALEEFRAEGRFGEDDPTGLAVEAHALETEPDFDVYVAALRERALAEGRRPEGWVPDTLLWYVDGTDYIGRLDIRHRLTPRLLEMGGHIGYDVRPSMRRRGHATQMLSDALPIAANLGINPALITCDETNVGSRKVIEANGGVFEDQRGLKLRFWVRTV